MSSANLYELVLNGETVCEAELNAYIAGHFSVPILMLSGDDAIAAEVGDSLQGCEMAVVKKAISYHSADSLTPADAIEILRAAARRALDRRGSIAPRQIDTPVAMDLAFKNHRPAELIAYLPNVERLDAHRVRFLADDILAASRFLEFALNYSADLTP